MKIATTLLNSAVSTAASQWDNPHEAAGVIFGAAVVAFFIGGVFFSDKSDKVTTILAITPGTLFLLIGLIIYLFG